MMINELGYCNAGIERAYCGGEGYGADAWEKLGKQTGKQQALFRDLEHHIEKLKR